MATIFRHLSIAELEERFRSAAEPVQGRHFQAIWLLAKGWTVVEAAAVLAFAPRWVEELAQRYNALGPEALGDGRHRNGRTATLLTADVLGGLLERVTTPPDEGGLWSGPKVARWMAKRLGLKKVHPQRGWDALKKIGWSIQTARPRHPRAATPEEQEAFKKSSSRSWRRPSRRTREGRSRSGRATSTASA